MHVDDDLRDVAAMWGSKKVGDYRGYALYVNPKGYYGFNAWMSWHPEKGCWCPYASREGAEKAIDAIRGYLDGLHEAEEA
jgi:hypothetical protein